MYEPDISFAAAMSGEHMSPEVLYTSVRNRQHVYARNHINKAYIIQYISDRKYVH